MIDPNDPPSKPNNWKETETCCISIFLIFYDRLWAFYVNVIGSDLVPGERKYNMLQYRRIEVILNKNFFSFLKKLVLLKWMLKTEQNSL
jgi:hypothetical protein